MSQNLHLYQFSLLKQQVLLCAGIGHILPGDCKMLANQIFKQTELFVSETTLKRVYGFAQAKFEASHFTKNALACFCGYAGWEDYLDMVQVGEGQQSVSMQDNSGLEEKEQ